MSKPKVLVCVPCGVERTRWINPLLFESLLMMQRDDRYELSIEIFYGFERYEVVRNACVKYARDSGAELAALVMIDNDMILPDDFGDILLQTVSTGKAVVGLSSAAAVLEKDVRPLTPQDNGLRVGDFQQTARVGAGVMIVSSEVWRVIPRGPWFRWLVNDDELLSMKTSEDYAFCELVQERGLTVWSHWRLAGHLKTTDITRHL
jgi:hypothetical protein